MLKSKLKTYMFKRTPSSGLEFSKYLSPSFDLSQILSQYSTQITDLS